MRPKPIVRLGRSDRAKRKFSEDVKQQVSNYLEFKERLESLKFVGRISLKNQKKAEYSAPLTYTNTRGTNSNSGSNITCSGGNRG